MQYNQIMIHFGELTTKGKNRRSFVDTLASNIRYSLREITGIKLRVAHDHIYIFGNLEQYEKILSILADVSGIHAISLVVKVSTKLEELKATALAIILEQQGKTFKVFCRRKDKAYPLISDEINRLLAGVIIDTTSWKVDIHNPDYLMRLEIHQDGAYFLVKTVAGSGGFPLGTMGKTLHLMSGGIDSPVAAYQLMRRGIAVEMIHFAAPPYTQAGVIDKLKDLLRVLTRYQREIKLHIIPFTALQLAIYQNAAEGYPITLMRRMMYRIAAQYAKHHKIVALSTGESLGQVASQTLESLATINDVTTMPVIRPLITSDKLSIIATARKIGTFDISVRPFDDCCTIFAPINPKTKPRIEFATKYERQWDYQAQIDEAIAQCETIFIKAEIVENPYL